MHSRRLSRETLLFIHGGRFNMSVHKWNENPCVFPVGIWRTGARHIAPSTLANSVLRGGNDIYVGIGRFSLPHVISPVGLRRFSFPFHRWLLLILLPYVYYFTIILVYALFFSRFRSPACPFVVHTAQELFAFVKSPQRNLLLQLLLMLLLSL